MSPVWTFDNHVQNLTGISWFEAEIALKELGYCICLNERILNAAGNLVNSGNEYFKVVKPPLILFGHNIYIIIFFGCRFCHYRTFGSNDAGTSNMSSFIIKS